MHHNAFRPFRFLTVFVLLLCLPAVMVCAAGADLYDEAVRQPGRSAHDLKRDARDHPVEILRLTKLGPGMRVADVLGGDGYYSELASYIVGPKGNVLLLNNKAFEEYSDSGWTARLAGQRLPNVEYRSVDLEHLGLGKETLDAVLLVKVYHDLNRPGPDGIWPKFTPGIVLDEIVNALKPGGVLLLVDHSAKPGTGQSQTELHRIDEQFARKDFESRGLVPIAESNLLRNPADSRDQRSFDSPMAGKTDRFVVVFQKKASPR